MTIHLKNEGQECKRVPFRRREVPVGEGELMERVKEGEYGQCTLCVCMKMEH
jgi:hypothetical protein